MEPRREEQQALEPGAGQRSRRFRIIKLEERIAPAKGGKGTHMCITKACTMAGCGSMWGGTCWY